MAKYPSWDKLNRRQQKLALERWHQRREGTTQTSAADAADTNPLYNPSATLSGRDLKTAVDTVVAGQFRPVELGLARQAASATRQNTALASRVAGYSDQLDKRADLTTAREEAIAERLNQQLATIGQDALSNADRVQAEEGARRQADVALRAAPSGTSDPVADELAAMRARAAADAQASRTAGAVMGGNYAQLANSNRGALALRGQEQQGDIANRLANELAEVRAKRTELGQAKGAERTKQLLEMRNREFENAAVRTRLQLSAEELRQDTEAQRKELALAHRRQREAEQENAWDRDDDAADNEREDTKLSDAQTKDDYQRQHKLGPYKPESPEEESARAQALKTDILNGVEDFKNLLGAPDKNGNKRSVERVQEIIRKRGAAPIAVLAIADLAQYGFVTPSHLRALRTAGVQIPKSWRAPKVKPSQGALDHPRT